MYTDDGCAQLHPIDGCAEVSVPDSPIQLNAANVENMIFGRILKELPTIQTVCL